MLLKAVTAAATGRRLRWATCSATVVSVPIPRTLPATASGCGCRIWLIGPG
ncbi:hypothetical protein [Planomonospora alba]|uniref:hypothetical protein n=1 Tax=Planomonospora alba TaxID=161354 RepID=UPI0031EE5466